MKFSYNWLKELSGTKLSAKNLAELLNMHSFEVKEVKKVGNDWVIDIDVLPNRMPDCASHIGIARECAALAKSKRSSQERQGGGRVGVQNLKSKIVEDKKLKTSDFVKVEVKDKYWCPRYCARFISNVKVKPSPKWLKERLEICGIQSINNIVDATNYTMLETGQPLHAFDADKLTNNTIIVRRGKKGERIITLDNKKIDLNDDILVIADSKEPLAIAGIKGGKKAEINSKTKNIILESANFDRLNIYQISKRINLQTDASLRFGAGLDPNLTSEAVNKAAFLIQKVAGGFQPTRPPVSDGPLIAKGVVDVYPKRVLPKKIRLNLNYLKSLLGVEIPQKKVIKILKNLEFGVKTLGKNVLEVLVPTRRLDIIISEDLIEEVGRIYGYEKISATFPLSVLVPPKRNENIFWENLTKNILKEAGFSEVYNYSFINEKDAKVFHLNITRPGRVIEVENPTSVDFKYLRPSLIPNLLKNIQKNQNWLKEIKIFELGKIFEKSKNKKEQRMLTGIITGDALKYNELTSGQAFYQTKGVIDLLLNKLGISNVWYDEYKPTPEKSKISIWHPKKCAEIKVDQEEIGFLGEISPRILEDLDIKNKVVLFDIDFEILQKLTTEEHEYRPISPYPAAIRDIAILVPLEVRVEEVLNKIEVTGGELIRDIDLFDIYEGEELPQGKKNLAFHIIYQAEDRTLSSKEIDEIQNKIITVLEEEPEWQVRR